MSTEKKNVSLSEPFMQVYIHAIVICKNGWEEVLYVGTNGGALIYKR